MDSELERLAHRRAEEYGDDTWKTTGNVLRHLSLGPLQSEGYLSPFVKIVSKLVRITLLPNHKDSWADIAIYAEIVFRHIRSSEPGGHGT